MSARPDPLAFLTGALSDKPYPGGVGLPGTGAKFTTDGAVQIWPGNTFLCHVIRPSPAFTAMMELQERLKRSPFANFFVHLPAPSFHMTVFQGMSPGDQGTPNWPADVPEDAARDTVTEVLRARVDKVCLPPLSIKATGLFCGNSLTIAGRDAAEEAKMRGARETLRTATGMSPEGFENYGFHITLGYLLHWLSPATAAELVAYSDETFALYEDALQDIPLAPCAFCNFDTMHHFEELMILR